MTPGEARALLWNALAPVERETIPLERATGRWLAGDFLLDRDSPPCDVSAMDGYVVRLADWRGQPMAVAGEISMGQAPGSIPLGAVLRIFTGGPVPASLEELVVIPREEVVENGDHIQPRTGMKKSLGYSPLPDAPGSRGSPELAHRRDACATKCKEDPHPNPLPGGEGIKPVRPGQHIRKQGENARAGEKLLEAGRLVTPGVITALAAAGYAEVSVFRPVRVAVLVTGNELLPVFASPQPWQIRDSNGPAVMSFLKQHPWITAFPCQHGRDNLEALTEALKRALNEADMVITTGGISMGDHDHMPAAISAVGGAILFQKLPIRPGKPILAARTAQGKAMLALPGNPVAVLTGLRIFAAAALHRLGGSARLPGADALVHVSSPGGKTVPMWWYRLVRESPTAVGEVELVENQGSGDVIAAGRSDGLIEIPPGSTGTGPVAYYRF